jgi:hypothetical protein
MRFLLATLVSAFTMQLALAQDTTANYSRRPDAVRSHSARERLLALLDKAPETRAATCEAGFCFRNCEEGYTCVCLTLSDGKCFCGDCLKKY